MTKKLQCERCGQAEKGEDLYYFDGEILCRYCIVSAVCQDGHHNCECIGSAGDKFDKEMKNKK